MKILISALALALAAPVAVQAAPAVEITTSVAARHGDLDLSRAGHASIMLRRLDRAALSVCGASEFSLREYQRAVRATACYGAAMDSSVASLGAPLVSSAYQGRGANLASN
ncbi:UrcA family protein [Phenylobacterium sp.]|uniref:UrcA family protein n=1 Tax=Phenylobacterium sp. TaxID=1871053 RepID=UPI00286CD96D|nr:UrcA family protein [Phenylobacterium sp.]